MPKIIAQTKTSNAWLINGAVYISPKYSTLDIEGNPTAGRWECYLKHWELYRDTAYGMFADV